MSNQQLKEVIDLLLTANYIRCDKNGYYFTEEFGKTIQEINNSERSLMVNSPVPKNTDIIKRMLPIDWELKFMSFIAEAKVPARLETNRGESYYANKYNEKALAVFKKAIEGGVDYNLLVKSTTLYYKGNISYKKTVGNYFTQGDWKTDYIALRDLIADGTSEQLEQHIKTETDNNEKSQYELG